MLSSSGISKSCYAAWAQHNIQKTLWKKAFNKLFLGLYRAGSLHIYTYLIVKRQRGINALTDTSTLAKSSLFQVTFQTFLFICTITLSLSLECNNKRENMDWYNLLSQFSRYLGSLEPHSSQHFTNLTCYLKQFHFRQPILSYFLRLILYNFDILWTCNFMRAINAINYR